MTSPTQMNCAHQGDGWCLDCVEELEAERAELEEALRHAREFCSICRKDRAEAEKEST